MLLIALRITSCQWTRFGQGLLAEKLSRTVFEPPAPGTVRKLERNEKRKKLENCSMTCAAGNDGCFNKIEDSQHHRIPDISLKKDKRNLEVFWGQDSPRRNRSCWFLLVFDLVVSFFKRFASACWQRYQPLTSACWLLNGDDMGWPYDPSINQPMGKPDSPTTWFHHTKDLSCLKVSRRCAQEEGRSSEREGASWQRVQGTEPRSPWSSRWGTSVKRHRVACISYTCSSWLGIVWYHQYHPVLRCSEHTIDLLDSFNMLLHPVRFIFRIVGYEMSQTWIMACHGLSKSWERQSATFEKRNLQILAPTS